MHGAAVAAGGAAGVSPPPALDICYNITRLCRGPGPRLRTADALSRPAPCDVSPAYLGAEAAAVSRHCVAAPAPLTSSRCGRGEQLRASSRQRSLCWPRPSIKRGAAMGCGSSHGTVTEPVPQSLSQAQAASAAAADSGFYLLKDQGARRAASPLSLRRARQRWRKGRKERQRPA